ncbi:MAG: hypothetical protein ACSHX8_02600 [Opitutaceae bacterium]
MKTYASIFSLFILVTTQLLAGIAEITSPEPSTTFDSSTQLFTWSDGGNGGRYILRVGTGGAGTYDIEYAGPLPAGTLSYSVSGLPNDQVVYV